MRRWERRILQSNATIQKIVILGRLLLVLWNGLRFCHSQFCWHKFNYLVPAGHVTWRGSLFFETFNDPAMELSIGHSTTIIRPLYDLWSQMHIAQVGMPIGLVRGRLPATRQTQTRHQSVALYSSDDVVRSLRLQQNLIDRICQGWRRITVSRHGYSGQKKDNTAVCISSITGCIMLIIRAHPITNGAF